MKTKVAAIYGKRDVRLREFELPEITDNELLVSVISDSVCLSTWKAALLGSPIAGCNTKRWPFLYLSVRFFPTSTIIPAHSCPVMTG